MVVTVVAQLIVKVPVLQEHSAEDPCFYQNLQRPEDGGPAKVRQLPVEAIGGEVTLLLGHGPNYGAPWGRRAVAPLLKGVQDLLYQS